MRKWKLAFYIKFDSKKTKKKGKTTNICAVVPLPCTLRNEFCIINSTQTI